MTWELQNQATKKTQKTKQKAKAGKQSKNSAKIYLIVYFD